MMAVRYSGQYAAAQLDKLPLPPSLQLEVAEYVGHHDLDLLLPPTYRPLARMLGRMPATHRHILTGIRIKAFDYELFNYHGEVAASCMTRRVDKLISVVRTGTLEEIRRLDWDQLMLYDLHILLEHTIDDAEFYRAWREKHGDVWPGRVGCASHIHQDLLRPYNTFWDFADRHKAHADSVSTIINRHNSGLYVARAFNRSNGEHDTDSDEL
jgi:hypothetical protein